MTPVETGIVAAVKGKVNDGVSGFFMMNSASQKTPWETISPEQREKLFPALTAAQIARVAAHGEKRQVSEGEVLVEQGDYDLPFVVVISGTLELVRNTGAGEELIVVYRA